MYEVLEVILKNLKISIFNLNKHQIMKVLHPIQQENLPL